MRRNYIVTFIDQGLTTGANMALQVLLIRLISADDYGRFALWQGVSLLLLGIQNALITTPLSVRLGAARDQSETLASDTLFDVANMAMTIGVFVIGLVAALAIEGAGQGTGRAMAISAYLATQLVYQYARSLAFARLAPFAVMRIDLVFVGVGAAIIGTVFLIGSSLSLAFCLGALAGAAAVAGLFGLMSEPGWSRQFPRLAALRAYGTIWQESRWALLGVATYELQTRSYVYIVTALSGAAAVAELYASQLPLRPTTLLYMAWSTLARPQLAIARREGRAADFSRIIVTHSAMLAGLVAAYFLVLWLAWPWVSHILYGDRYSGIALIVIGWGFGSAAGAVRGVFNTALQSMHEFKSLSFANVCGGAASIAGIVIVASFASYALIPFGVLLGDVAMMAMVLRAYRSARSRAQPVGGVS